MIEKQNPLLPNSIYDFDKSELEILLKNIGEPEYRIDQLWKGIYHNFYNSFADFSNFPNILRKNLAERIIFSSLVPDKTITSSNGETSKVLFRLQDDSAIETVLMRYKHRFTLCISTQVGCAIGCKFCATGKMGFKRNLTIGEIVEQVIYFAGQLNAHNEHLTNIVFMGMGEPFHNYEAVLSAARIFNHSDGFNFSERRMTISTVGLVPSIIRFSKEKTQINLAISLHAANDSLRSSFIPINQKYPLNDLLTACKEYIHKTNRRITFEWALIQGVNDTKKDAIELSHLLKNMLCHVNVIPLNPISGFQGQASNMKQALLFQNMLQSEKIPCTIRLRRGLDIQAGCGQLATLSKEKE